MATVGFRGSAGFDDEYSMSTVRKRLHGVMVREVEGELLVLDDDSHRIHKLNPTASLIWSRCDTASPTEIAAELVAAYDIEEEQALIDVTTTLAKLRELWLVGEP